MELPLAAAESVTKVDALVFFRTQLQNKAKIVMESAVHISYDSGSAGAGLYTSGNMVFTQTYPLPVKGGYVTMYSNTDLLDPSKISRASEGDIRTILEQISERNLTMTYVPELTHWTPVVDSASASTFTLTADIKIPTTDIVYIPTAVEVLRDAWIKYLSMFVLVGFFLEKLCSFVYFHQIVETKMLVETVGSNIGVPHFKRF